MARTPRTISVDVEPVVKPFVTSPELRKRREATAITVYLLKRHPHYQRELRDIALDSTGLLGEISQQVLAQMVANGWISEDVAAAADSLTVLDVVMGLDDA